MTVHTYPLNDLREHFTDGRPCPCNPRIDRYDGSGGAQVIHNSWDGREITERAMCYIQESKN